METRGKDMGSRKRAEVRLTADVRAAKSEGGRGVEELTFHIVCNVVYVYSGKKYQLSHLFLISGEEDMVRVIRDRGRIETDISYRVSTNKRSGRIRLLAFLCWSHVLTCTFDVSLVTHSDVSHSNLSIVSVLNYASPSFK